MLMAGVKSEWYTYKVLFQEQLYQVEQTSKGLQKWSMQFFAIFRTTFTGLQSLSDQSGMR